MRLRVKTFKMDGRVADSYLIWSGLCTYVGNSSITDRDSPKCGRDIIRESFFSLLQSVWRSKYISQVCNAWKRSSEVIKWSNNRVNVTMRLRNNTFVKLLQSVYSFDDPWKIIITLKYHSYCNVTFCLLSCLSKVILFFRFFTFLICY